MSFEDKYAGKSLAELAQAMKDVKGRYDDTKAQNSEVYKEFDFLRLVLVPNMMEEMGLSSTNVKGVGRLTIAADLHASIPAAVRDQGYDWLRQNGHEALIKETVNASTFKAFCKEQIREGEELPEFFKVEPFDRASLTKV